MSKTQVGKCPECKGDCAYCGFCGAPLEELTRLREQVSELQARVDEESQAYVDMMELRDEEIRKSSRLREQNKILREALEVSCNSSSCCCSVRREALRRAGGGECSQD